MQLEPGATLSERLTLVAPLGAGGMGSVWIAENTALDVQVAVKVLNEKYAGDAEAVARFRGEARALARVASDHVVRIYDFATLPNGVPYMVMELLDGEDLEKLVRRSGTLTVAETARIIAQACDALSKIHAAGIVHRDVKPENLFLVRESGGVRVKLFDFGIAKEKGTNIHLTRTGTTVGTPLYMSPEQVLGGPLVDYRCDLWGLSVVAYHCLSGCPPFEGETYGALCVAIHKASFPAPTARRPDLPRALDAWFAKALSHDVKQRFDNAEELRETFLDACGAGPGTRAMPKVASLAPLARDLDDQAMSVTGKSGPPRREGIGRYLAVAVLVGVAFGGIVEARGLAPLEDDATVIAERLAVTTTTGARLFPALAEPAPRQPVRELDRAANRRSVHRESDELGRAYPRDDATALDARAGDTLSSVGPRPPPSRTSE